MLKILLLQLLISSCAFGPSKRAIEGRTDKRSVQKNGICYQVMIGVDFEINSGKVVCSDNYPRVTKGDRVSMTIISNGETSIELDKLKSFETFLSSLEDKRSIDYYSFIYFDEKKMINHAKYREAWSASCPSEGLSCRLLAYLEKTEKNESRFFDLMEKGCKDKDIISCFNIVVRKKNLKKSQKALIQKSIKEPCMKVKDTDDYHDFCGELLNGI
jgi:hypothetical protein